MCVSGQLLHLGSWLSCRATVGEAAQIIIFSRKLTEGRTNGLTGCAKRNKLVRGEKKKEKGFASILEGDSQFDDVRMA